MKQFIKGKEEAVFLFTNHCVDNLQQTEQFNSNYIAKCLLAQIDQYKAIIESLLDNKDLGKSETTTNE